MSELAFDAFFLTMGLLLVAGSVLGGLGVGTRLSNPRNDGYRLPYGLVGTSLMLYGLAEILGVEASRTWDGALTLLRFVLMVSALILLVRTARVRGRARSMGAESSAPGRGV